MPVTTFRTKEPPKHKDKELQDLLNSLSSKTREKWFAETVVCNVTKRWFGIDKVHTYTNLLKHLRPSISEYQDFQCVTTIGEAKAYLIGALGAYEKC